MQEYAPTIAPEIEALIKRLVAEHLGEYGLRSVDVRPGADHDGDPIIVVEVAYPAEQGPSSNVWVQFYFDLRDTVRRAGEPRAIDMRRHELARGERIS